MNPATPRVIGQSTVAIPSGAERDAPGVVKAFAGFNVPATWLPCDGAAVARAAYAGLFAALTLMQGANFISGSPVVTGLADTSQMRAGMFVGGVKVVAGAKILSVDSGSQITMDIAAIGASGASVLLVAPWGVGNNSTTFNIPDIRGRTIVGSGPGAGAGLTVRVLGATGGVETVTLGIPEIPAHHHTINAFDTTNTDHEHIFDSNSIAGLPDPKVNAATLQTDDEGGGGAHENMPPFAVCQWIIKT